MKAHGVKFIGQQEELAPIDWIAHIREDIEASRSARLWKDSLNMLSTVSESIFSRSAHFILELLQNAEDAGSMGGAAQGKLEFRISPTRIRISHNGISFRPGDVDAICGVRSTKKPEQGTLGYLGIGFKSVFKVTDRPQIHSGGFHFEFNKNAYRDPTSELWQIMPIWVDQAAEPVNDDVTTFILLFRSPEAYQQTLGELRKLDVHIFLFLKWLKILKIVDESSGKTTTIENLGQVDKIVSLRKNNVTHRFVTFSRQGPVPPEVAKDPALEFYKRQNVRQREVVIAFAIGDTGDLEAIEDASTLGSVSSFLPLVEEKSGAKFLIQGDFLVQPGREAIQYELPWNHWIIEEAAEAAREAIEQFKQHPVWKGQFLRIFNFTSYTGQLAFETLFGPKLHEPLSAYLTTSVYLTASGHHAKPDQVVQPDKGLKGLLIDSDLPSLFNGKPDLLLADSQIEVSVLPQVIKDRVNRITLEQVGRNESFLIEKLKEPSHVEWFLRLYTAMAETGRDFTTEQRRNLRGRIMYTESPIYILTDHDQIVSSKSVYLRNIPDEVLELRETFIEVEGVLSAYQLIHPDVAVPELIPFFKERTHAQSIDYNKICREVFLPQVGIDKKAPPKDKLIAYTRLLQKGPEISEPIWVVTENGDIKPANHVFLGIEYSPSEDWQKHVKYSPQIEFLSPEYLKDIAQQDIPEWKAFFLQAGAKESGEASHVEEFAIAFVKDKLGLELVNFVPKERHQYGYDLEARLIKDNRLVKIEVKGRRQEGAIELEGNEPQAAKQAMENGEAFWLCIVPGVPENPELWVVDKACEAGEYKTLTIDVSKWKKYGRRVA